MIKLTRTQELLLIDLGWQVLLEKATQGNVPKRKYKSKKKFSPAGKKAISEGMRKYWKNKRATAAKK